MKETALTANDNRRKRGGATHLLLSPGFLVALLILAVNDHVLKAAYGNWLTGKLSDFAGLFAFSLFLCAARTKWRTMACTLTAFAFIGWKSPVSDPIVAAWNALGIWPVHRVLDATDAIALIVLPVAWWYARTSPPTVRLRSLRPVSALCAVMLFAATSQPEYPHADGTTFVVPYDTATVRKALVLMSKHDSTTRRTIYLEGGLRIYPNDWEFELTLSPRSGDSAVFTMNRVTAYRDDPSDKVLSAAHIWFTDSILQRVNTLGDSLRRAENKSGRK